MTVVWAQYRLPDNSLDVEAAYEDEAHRRGLTSDERRKARVFLEDAMNSLLITRESAATVLLLHALRLSES